MIKPSDRAWFQGVRWLEVQIVSYLRNSLRKKFYWQTEGIFFKPFSSSGEAGTMLIA